MATIELKKISHSYQMERCGELPENSRLDAQFVIRDLDLTWEKGSANALLGPSGCGKTTILRMIAGFDLPDTGEILLDGRNIADIPPEMRPLHTVFQSYALFPHLSVADNVAFPLRMSKISAVETQRRVSEMLETVAPGGQSRCLSA